MSKDKTTNLRQPVRPELLLNVCRSQSLPSSAASSTTAESGALGDGISGSAMAVPPPKASAVRLDNTFKTAKGGPRKSLLVSKSDTLNCNKKQTQEVIDRSQELRDALVFRYGLPMYTIITVQIYVYLYFTLFKC